MADRGVTANASRSVGPWASTHGVPDLGRLSCGRGATQPIPWRQDTGQQLSQATMLPRHQGNEGAYILDVSLRAVMLVEAYLPLG